jgi:hypothetical protein
VEAQGGLALAAVFALVAAGRELDDCSFVGGCSLDEARTGARNVVAAER